MQEVLQKCGLKKRSNTIITSKGLVNHNSFADLLKYQSLEGITVHQSAVIAEQLVARHCSKDMKVCVCVRGNYL